MKPEIIKSVVASFLFSVLFTGVYSFSEKQVDSLRNIWTSEHFSDTVRMQALYDMAIDGYLYSQPDSARYFGEQLLRLTEEFPNAAYEADAHSLIGNSYFLKGQFNEAIASFSKFGEIAANNNFQSRLIKSKMNIGTSHIHMGEFEESLKLLNESLELLEASEDTLGIAKCLNNIGLALLHQGNYNAALKEFKTSLPLLKSAGNKQLLAYSLGNIATVHSFQGKTDEALATHRSILEIHEEQNDVHGMITAHNNLADILFRTGYLSEALEHQRAMAKLSAEAGDQNGSSLALMKIANAYLRYHVPDSSLQYINRAIKIREQLDDRKGLATAYIQKGRVFLKLGMEEEALQFFDKSYELFSSMGNETGTASALIEKASLDLKNKMYKRADSVLREAVRINRKHNHQMGLSSALIKLGQVHLAMAHLKEAEEYADEGLQLATETEDTELLRSAYFIQYQISKELQKTEDALAYFEQYNAIKDSILSDENHREVLRHQLQFEFERKSLLLEVEQAAKDAEHAIRIEKQRRYLYTLSGGGLLLIALGTGSFFIYRQRQRNKALADSIASRDYERNRLSRELHDGVASELHGLQMAIDSGQNSLDAKMLNDQLRRIHEDVRHISHDLAMPDIQHTSLPEMARYLVNRWKHVGREVSIDISPETNSSWEIKPEKALHLYRILQEGLINALRYAPEDREIIVRLHLIKGSVKLEIINHFTETLVGPTSPGIGLKNLKERAELIGGSAKVEMDNGLAKLLAEIKL